MPYKHRSYVIISQRSPSILGISILDDSQVPVEVTTTHLLKSAYTEDNHETPVGTLRKRDFPLRLFLNFRKD